MDTNYLAKMRTDFFASYKLFAGLILLLVLILSHIFLYEKDTRDVAECLHYNDDIDDEVQQPEGSNAICKTEERVKYYLDQCERHGWTDTARVDNMHTYRNLYCDDNKKLLYCEIPKVGSTTVVRLLLKLAGKTLNGSLDWRHQFDDKKLRKVGSVSSIRDKLETYQKILIVRHPLDRLLSAYHDKFSTGKPDVVPFKHDDERMARLLSNHFGHDYFANMNVTLHEFLHLVAEERDSKEFFDRHWDTYYDQCHPCEVKYNTIIKLETFDTDMKKLLPSIGASEGDLAHYHNTRNLDPHTVLAKAKPELESVDVDILDKLQAIFKKDMSLFGYTWSYQDGAACSITTNDTTCC